MYIVRTSIVAFKLQVFDISRGLFSQRHGVRIQSTMFQNIAHLHSSPFGSTHGTYDPMGRNVNLVIIIVHIFTPVSSTLQSCDNFMFGKFLL